MGVEINSTAEGRLESSHPLRSCERKAVGIRIRNQASPCSFVPWLVAVGECKPNGSVEPRGGESSDGRKDRF